MQTFLLSFLMAFLWMIFARQFSIEGFIIGYIFGFGVLRLIDINTRDRKNAEPVHLSRIPSQLIAVFIYGIRLAVDVLLSGIDVASRVLRPSLPINPAVQEVSTQDETNNELISALSAHSITITPGELVIDYEKDENGQTIMLVHTLDKGASDMNKLVTDQTKRLKLIRRILGQDEPESTKGN